MSFSNLCLVAKVENYLVNSICAEYILFIVVKSPLEPSLQYLPIELAQLYSDVIKAF